LWSSADSCHKGNQLSAFALEENWLAFQIRIWLMSEYKINCLFKFPSLIFKKQSPI
jgi:hypothetical protein